MNLITPQESYEMLTKGLAYGVDVREIDEWDAGHSDLFDLNPLSNFDANQIPRDKPVVVICRSGRRSAQVCEILEPLGVNVSNIRGGMLEWQNLSLPMVAKSGTPLIS